MASLFRFLFLSMLTDAVHGDVIEGSRPAADLVFICRIKATFGEMLLLYKLHDARGLLEFHLLTHYASLCGRPEEARAFMWLIAVRVLNCVSLFCGRPL